ncbi:hypothetical protein Hdeb2414_s0009g00310541 [Helianthus debilis subsp. tardiflorus]
MLSWKRHYFWHLTSVILFSNLLVDLNDFRKENDMLVSMDTSVYKGNSGEIF